MKRKKYKEILILHSLYYDEKLKRWVDPNADPNEADGLNAKPPPTDMQLISGSNSLGQPTVSANGPLSKMPSPPGPPAPTGGNKFAAGRDRQYLSFL